MKLTLKFDEINRLENPYSAADKANALLKKKTAKRLSKCRGDLILLLWLTDEVMKKVTALYRDMDKDASAALLDVAKASYRQCVEGGEEPDNKWLSKEILKSPCPVTGYIYENEADRKKDKAIEAISAVRKSADKADALIRNVKYRQTQSEYYTDYVTDMAMLKAYSDADVQKVKWLTMKDEKTCADCKGLDGKVFPIDSVPDKPHPRCRCRIVPVKE